MVIIGTFWAIFFFTTHFGMKYSAAAESMCHARSLTLKEVYAFSLRGHRSRRAVIFCKWMTILSALTVWLGWDIPLPHKDAVKVWGATVGIILQSHFWARVKIYQIAHFGEHESDTSRPVLLTFMRKSIKETGWMVRGDDLLARIANGAMALFILTLIYFVIVLA